MTHNDLKNKTLVEMNKLPNVKIWNNPVGFGFTGKTVNSFTKNGKKYIVLENPRPVKFGLTKGSCDLIGFETIKIAGVKVARFLGIEIKVKKDKLRPEQERFIDMCNNMGANCFIKKD